MLEETIDNATVEPHASEEAVNIPSTTPLLNVSLKRLGSRFNIGSGTGSRSRLCLDNGRFLTFHYHQRGAGLNTQLGSNTGICKLGTCIRTRNVNSKWFLGRVGWLNLANVRLTLGERKDKELLLDECSNGKNYGLLGVHVD
ncbi:hypothetical protein L2E82_15231 [Cichorium intybus]|uniref:Uncharacterized protein n=1 Tax=Cichorium intybus TaxID=13427 RepID=A0ACB9F1J9_CICIN|nr:hypothetical protein L2E82_15231 [Cichorium intybus]